MHHIVSQNNTTHNTQSDRELFNKIKKSSQVEYTVPLKEKGGREVDRERQTQRERERRNEIANKYYMSIFNHMIHRFM